ncbi:MAG: small multi-drug export protein, partial [bacterium]
MKELLVVTLAATPIIEVRGAILLGIAYGLPALKNILLCVMGSVLPVLPVLWSLNTLTKILRKNPFWDRFFLWLFARTRAKSGIIEKYETIGLMLFIATPLPGTGVWTGCVAGYLLGLTWFEIFIASV